MQNYYIKYRFNRQGNRVPTLSSTVIHAANEHAAIAEAKRRVLQINKDVIPDSFEVTEVTKK